MYKVHGYLDGKKVIDWIMKAIPSNGDTVRFADDKFAKVTEVIWCFDENRNEGQRVNLRMEAEIADLRAAPSSAQQERQEPK